MLNLILLSVFKLFKHIIKVFCIIDISYLTVLLQVDSSFLKIKISLF